MKKVLVVITTSFVPYGGLTTVAMNYYRRIDHNSIHMDFASTNDVCDSLKNELYDNGSKYFKLPNRTKNIFQYMLNLKKIAENYDVVHIHANSATATVELLASKAAGVKKRIIHIHNSTCKHKVIHNIMKPIFNRCYTDAVACSELAGNWIFGKGRFVVLNNAIDLEKYEFKLSNRTDIRNKYNINDNAFVIGHVGKINKQKNHAYLIDILYKISKMKEQVYLMLVGDGDLKDQIESKARQLGVLDRVFFCGMQESAVKYYSAFDVFMFPSLWEGLPLSVLEAQANGLNCIVSDKVTKDVNMGGIRFLSIDNESIDNWSELASKIISRNKNHTRYWDRIKESGFDINSSIDVLENIYLE